MLTLFQMIGASFLLVQLLMLICWCCYYVNRQANIIDMGWVVGFFTTMLVYFILGQGDLLKTAVLLTMVLLWASRLSWHLYQRYQQAAEDLRYADIRERWGERNSDFKFLILFVFQGVLIVLLSLPFLIVSCCPNPHWSVWEVVGVVVWACGVVGEFLADEQLRAFKASAANSAAVCTQGLWRYSRHPNYFFEWIVWVGYFLFALPAPGGFLAVLAPALIYYLLRYVSGIPMTEAHLQQTKGEAYLQYQQTTSQFFPWFRRNT